MMHAECMLLRVQLSDSVYVVDVPVDAVSS